MNGRTTAICMFFITDTWHTRLVRPIALRFGLEQALEQRASPRGSILCGSLRSAGAIPARFGGVRFLHALAVYEGVKICPPFF